MKSFLCINKKPICRWTKIPQGTFFEGNIPIGYDLGICPGEAYMVIDVDRHGVINGFDSIPSELKQELNNTLHYPTRNNGMHYWFKNTSKKTLANKTSGLGIDLRIEDKGYVIWYKDGDIRDYISQIKEPTSDMNSWVESMFSRLSRIRK